MLFLLGILAVTGVKLKDFEAMPDDKAEDEESRLMKEWETHMKDFVPADMMTFDLPARSEEEFFETIDVIPSKVRGAWFIASGEKPDVELTIKDPFGESLIHQKNKKEDIFYFDAKSKGTFSFKFKNNKMLRNHVITFALHCGNSTEELLLSEHLSPLEEEIMGVQKSVKDFQVDQQFAALRQESHYKTLSGANSNVLWMSLVECIGVVGVTAWQLYYVKKLLDNRRVL